MEGISLDLLIRRAFLALDWIGESKVNNFSFTTGVSAFVTDVEDEWLISATSKAKQLIVESVVWLLFETLLWGTPNSTWTKFLTLQGERKSNNTSPIIDSRE